MSVNEKYEPATGSVYRIMTIAFWGGIQNEKEDIYIIDHGIIIPDIKL